ncbi:4-hydroxythreonine-4-phosphate dehydrogenase PdxA [Lewinella sp. JB7]|uniref:4-hydroxythreonine-4-phosphate dehydrogenase PdxA n=1 Tax=Lewinella sp. JB7 TaxID=2962887 RepID=UPI0020C93B3B|nr:4-hydroxythreonine-4-phosphate dehydrogenase PdxA [Lewinella sp. JB7]MCP9234406.1 4-hydroxythreonine-4-phosphate dehydrogenase PdxA [Lewinella sp. JB7]
MDPLRVGISVGDVNGIGPEVIVKALRRNGVLDLVTPVIYATPEVFTNSTAGGEEPLAFTEIDGAETAEDGEVSLVICWEEPIEYSPGQPTQTGGRVAARSLDRAVEDLKQGRLDALVTAPINKSVMPRDAFPYPGHTEMLTERLEADESLMFLVADDLRVGVVTNHIPVSRVANEVTQDKIVAKLKIMDQSLRSDFGIVKPLIGVLALNPHAGDEGRIGDEDEKIVRPAVETAKAAGIMALGPFPADGFFGSGKFRKFDAVLAMYHDQGLVPFKALSFGKGVNFTAGLPAIRTSPDHGTAYDLVGQDKASPDSFLAALFLARDAFINRQRYLEDTANPLESRMHLVYKRKPRAGGSGKSGRGRGKG